METRAATSCIVSLIALIMTLLAGPAAAMTSCRTMLKAPGPSRVEMSARTALERVTVREMYGRDALSARTVAHKRQIRDGALRARTVERRVDKLWRRRIPGDVNPQDLNVTIDVRAVAGISRARFEAVTGVRPPFILLPLPPAVLCRNATHKVVEGGAIVQFVFGDQALTGQYNVEIETRVELP